MDGRGLASRASPIHISPIRSPVAGRSFISVDADKRSVPTSPTYSKQAWPTLKKRSVAESNLAPLTAYATPGSSAVDLWKRLARKAELELHLEVDSHRADNAKNNATIHRANRRLIPLEKALGKAKEALKHQEKVINYLKCHLMGANERKSMEISYLRSQNENFQKMLAGANQTNGHKILELQEELHQADSRAETLQAQINEIYKNVDDEPDSVDGSGTRAGSPACPKDGRGSSGSTHIERQTMGLRAVAKIHKMRLSKQYLREKVTESEEEITLLVQENDRLRKLAQEAVDRSNKFLDLAHTLKADRDLTMSRLKDTEDIIKSLEALKDFVHSYLKATSPRLANLLSGPYSNKMVHKRQEALLTNTNTEDALKIETSELTPMKVDTYTKVVYFQDGIGAGPQTIGESLLKKLQDVFQVLAYKVETANQTAKTVKKEGEKIRLTMLEAFQVLRGQKGSKLNTADDVALGVLIAVRDVKQTLVELEKERALLKASESVEDEKLMLLQSQVHELSMDKLALLEFLESVKSIIRAANAGQGVVPYMKGFFNRRVNQGENISEVLEMIGKLISERDEARSLGGGLLEDKLLKEKELSDLRKLHAQSQTLATNLQVEKDLLKKERNELKASCEDLIRQKISWDAEKKGKNEKKILDLKSEIHDLILDRAALLETLEAIKNTLASSKTGYGNMQHLKGFLKRSIVQGRNVSEVVDMVGELVAENEGGKLKGSRLMEERERKDRELDDMQNLCENLKAENGLLHSNLNELQKSAQALMSEKESINSSSAVMEKKILELQTQFHGLTQERAASQETLNILKRTFRAAESTPPPTTQDSGDDLLTSSEGQKGSELVALAEMLVKERNEARSRGKKCEDELETRENELVDLRHSYAESKSLSERLHNDKDNLEKEVKNLRNTFRTIKGSIYGDSEPDLDTPDRRSSPLESGNLTLESMVAEVLIIKEKLNAANSELARDRRVFERLFLEAKSMVSKENITPSDWESEASALISLLKGLQAEKQQLGFVVTACTELHAVLDRELKKLFEIISPADLKSTSLVEDKCEMSAQEHVKADSDFRKIVNDLPRVVEEVRRLKREQTKMEQNLQSLELEKEAAVRKSSEHLEKIRRLSDCSQQEVNELREQLDKVQSLVHSVSVEKNMSSEDVISNQEEQHNSILNNVNVIIEELTALRTEKADLEVAVGELQSKGGSEQEKLHDLAIILSTAEAQVQMLSSSASAANSKIQSLESQLAAAEAQLSELFGMLLLSKDGVQGSAGTSSRPESRTADMDISAIIKAVQNRVSELLSTRDEEVTKRAKEVMKLKGQQDAVGRDLKLSAAEVERLREKLNGQAEFIKKHTADWTRLVESLKSEIARLGGSDLKDEGGKLRKAIAEEKVKELLSSALTRNPSTSSAQTSTDASPSGNPLCSLATFQVELLVNSKVHSQLRVAGHNGGLCQAALHYFLVNGTTGEITFENAAIPGSQSSNLVVDLFMQPVDMKKAYQTQDGDILGLRVKLSAYSDPSPREVLHNTSIMRTDEVCLLLKKTSHIYGQNHISHHVMQVLDAIQGQVIQNFSLWPDLASSWRWERDAKKNRWSLVSVRWRFLLKNIFPDLSAPLQDLTIKGAGAPRSSSIHIF